jgi:hypothetical protein
MSNLSGANMTKYWTTDASTEGLPPGVWPATFEFTPPGGYSTRTVLKRSVDKREDEVLAVVYSDGLGNFVKVFND